MNSNKDLPTPGADQTLSRRTVLKATGLTALFASVGAGGIGATSAVAQEAPSQFDAIVIGAGFAGVTAARELQAQGRRTVLLEARGRIGGRTWTDSLADTPIELGGAWVHESQTYVTSELRRYGIPAVAGGVLPTSAIYPTPDGYGTFDPATAGAHVGELFDELFDGSRQYFERPLDPLFRRDLLQPIDGLSLRDRIEQLALPEQDNLWLRGITSGYGGGSSDHSALTALAQWWSLAGWTIEGWDSLTVFRIVGGTVALLRAMLDSAGVELRLNTPVTAIADEGSRVRVTARSGRQFVAPVVVMAVPANVWRTIRFTPALPRVHADATAQGIGVPDTAKLSLRVRGIDPLFAQGAEGDPVSSLFPDTTLPNGDLLMIAFIHDPSIDVNNVAQVETAVQQIVPQADVVAVRGQNWSGDRYSLGGWALRQPNQLLTQLPAIQQPHGRIAFASGDIASGWNGFIDGAIESGFRAAEQLERLYPPSLATTAA
jgi:monoamine oxidase